MMWGGREEGEGGKLRVKRTSRDEQNVRGFLQDRNR